jgi:xanthine dehydrogenase accessory factor
MDERLFRTMARWLAEVPVVLATVIATRGATPRKDGSRMLIGPGRQAFSIGGGLAEASVIEAARTLLEPTKMHSSHRTAQVAIDLSGRPGAAGICGGTMQIALRRWMGDSDRLRAQQIADTLAKGNSTPLYGEAYGANTDQTLIPNARLLIFGAGHCAAALCDLAKFLDYDIWIYDQRQEYLHSPSFATAHRVGGRPESLRQAFNTDRPMQVVLLNRDFAADVASLRAIKGLPTQFIGMMGSQRRIKTVLDALADQPDLATRLRAPVGIDIQAHTPHEIAISILAQLVQSNSGRA